MSLPSPSPVRVLAAGAVLSLSSVACAGRGTAPPGEPAPPAPPRTANPPPPTDVDAGTPAVNLPRWEDVPSGHPAGATNPPMPVLEVTEDGSRCFKAWQSPMVRDPDLLAAGGRVLASADAATGTEVVCDAAKASALLDRHAKQQTPGTEPGPPPPGE